jgi:tRNA-splicing ligase RtcB
MSNFNYIETGTGVNVKAWTKGVLFEEEAQAQVRKMASLPFVRGHIAIMPDVHAGMGSTVGSVIPTKGAIVPACVGVDIGCVDKDTEFLSPDGWKKISEYSDEMVMQYDPATGLGEFVTPSAFIKLPCSEFYHIHTKYGVDQMLSAEHKVLYAKYDRSYKFDKLDTISAKELAEKHNKLALGFRGRFLTSFTPAEHPGRGCVTGGEAKLRVMVMVMADGHFPNPNTNNCVLSLKKTRKIERAQALLNQAGIEFVLNENGPATTIRFTAPFHEKTMEWLWYADPRELRVICDEVFHWDGNAKERCFYTRVKESADFMSYAFSACGYRAVMRMNLKDGVPDYRVFAHLNTKVGINGTPKTAIALVPSQDGFKYCFTLPSGFWVMRRNGVVAMTGNCGMMAIRTSLKAKDLPDSLAGVRAAIERNVPVGRTDNGGRNDRGAWSNPPSSVITAWHGMKDEFEKLITKHPKMVRQNDDRPVKQLCSLGTGNHFIEVCLDETQDVWVMLHSGSRGIGNSIGSYFISIAKEEMKKYHIHLIDQDLSYLSEGTTHFDDYIDGVHWAQNYALKNRELMMERVLQSLRDAGLPPFQARIEAVNCHHNYVSKEHHFGENVLVTRKGAVRAAKGVMGIIPGSMGAKSFIVRGLGNPDSFDSCSHGAGRTMSRTAAKKLFTVEDHKKATEGIECRKDEDVIDETPACYKDIQAVMDAQSDLIEIVHTLKQVVVVKG